MKVPIYIRYRFIIDQMPKYKAEINKIFPGMTDKDQAVAMSIIMDLRDKKSNIDQADVLYQELGMEQ